MVKRQPDMELVARPATGGTDSSGSAQHLPDITLMDLRLPDMSGIDA